MFNALFLVVVGLFCMCEFSNFDIKSQLLKKTIYYGVIVLPIVLLVFNCWFVQTLRFKFFSILLPSFIIILVIFLGLLKILFHSSSWKTQLVKYKHKSKSNFFIEYQMKDLGALGYKQRTVQVSYYSKYFMKIENFHATDLDFNWIEVNDYKNELNLKY